MSYYGFRPCVPVAKRRAQAAREVKRLKKKGRVITPVTIEGRTIARNFWGKAWCENLERYSDFEYRLPRGKTYVRNGSVIDLQIERGQVRAMVSGSEIYEVKIDIAAAPLWRWKAICADCAGSVSSLVELLRGKLAKNVMERMCRDGDGLFPAPSEIKMSCTCPDWAGMCKHVAAALYGAGARLDAAPDLLFALRGVDRAELIGSVSADLPMTRTGAARERILADDDVAALFGIEIVPPSSTPRTADKKRKPRKRKPRTQSQTQVQAAKGSRSRGQGTALKARRQANEKDDAAQFRESGADDPRARDAKESACRRKRVENRRRRSQRGFAEAKRSTRVRKAMCPISKLRAKAPNEDLGVTPSHVLSGHDI